MQRHDRALIYAVALAVVASVAPALTSIGAEILHAQDNVVRRAHVPLRPLADQLLPGDKVVEFFVDAEIDRVMPDKPLTAMEWLGMAIADAEQVVLFQLETSEARLIDNGAWIATRLGGKVVDVLKRPAASTMRSGSQIYFQMGGGELRINGVTVRASGRSPYEIGNTYIGFLRDELNPARELTSAIDSAYPLLIERGRLKAVGGHSLELEGLALADVRGLIAKGR